MYLPHIAMGREIITQLHNTKSPQIKFKIIESARFASLGGFGYLREKDSAFLFMYRGIKGGFCGFCVRFCGIVESRAESNVDSAKMRFLVDWSR